VKALCVREEWSEEPSQLLSEDMQDFLGVAVQKNEID
jgi:hypothetical protein